MISNNTILERLKKYSDYAHKKYNGQRLDEFFMELSLAEIDELVAILEMANFLVPKSCPWCPDDKNHIVGCPWLVHKTITGK